MCPSKKSLLNICDTLTEDFEKLMDKAEKKNDMALVLERKDSLKRKKSEKRKEIWEIQSTLETLEKKKKAIVYFIQCSIFCRIMRCRFISLLMTVFGQNFRIHYQ